MSEYDATQDMPPDMPIPEPKPVEKPRGRVGTVIGNYTVEGVLGRGGMGVVYRARQGELNRFVALKMLTGHYGQHELQRFLAEARTAAALQHANIVHIYEVGEIDGAPFFSMEYVEGGTLTEKLRQGLPTPRASAELLMPVARALHFAHQHGVIHRDMKPQNILIDPDGVPKVADFGIAKRLDDDSGLTHSGAVIGTPAYMAPEQAGGTSRDAGPAADVYALGAILYEMLTGRPPFLPEESETPMTVRVLTEDTPSPVSHRPEIPREIEVICMKCLQKDPRDRYASAAAFAEDLRRFLDDEGILARPPSRMMRAIKWTRRHPWKFTTRAALLALLAYGGHSLWQWEFYQRPHVRHAAAVDYVNGVLEPVVSLTKAQVDHRDVSLRVTRRGRRGPVTQVEVVNSRGNPAVLRRVDSLDRIPLYIEGLVDAQPWEERMPESTKVEFLYDGNAVREATGRGRDGTVNWRMLYDRQIASVGVTVARARFVNLRGFEKGSPKGAAYMEFERDATGRDVRVSFFNSAGRPAANGEGAIAYKLTRDAAGRIVELVNLDRDGHPAPNRLGLTSYGLIWDAGGRVKRIEIRNDAGGPAAVAAVEATYDAAGNGTQLRRLEADGHLAYRDGSDWAVQEIGHNERGEVTHRKFLKQGPAGTLEKLSEKSYDYDEFGYPADIRFSGNSEWRTALRHDVNGNVLEEQYLDAQGHPAPQAKAGYAIKRFAYARTPQGLSKEERYFDAAGGKTYSDRGYHHEIDEYDLTGMLRRKTTEEYDPRQYSFYRGVIALEWDEQGRALRKTTRFEDQQGRLATNAGLDYTERDDEFDEQGREIRSWQFGWPEKIYGASTWRSETEWYSSGVMRRQVWQACDANRRPLKVTSTNYPARTEEVLNAIGKLERKLESGFDESRLGYESREIRLAGGAVESVTHRAATGSVVESIRVMITAIYPGGQPRTAELRPGDQFLSANGAPITSAYEWLLGNSFTGGWIEVLRHGQRLRIEGFQAGKLGIGLEDRGPGVP